jgi:DNA-directed RNA polymerase subunit RPC12/RpoP
MKDYLRVNLVAVPPPPPRMGSFRCTCGESLRGYEHHEVMCGYCGTRWLLSGPGGKVRKVE